MLDQETALRPRDALVLKPSTRTKFSFESLLFKKKIAKFTAQNVSSSSRPPPLIIHDEAKCVAPPPSLHHLPAAAAAGESPTRHQQQHKLTLCHSPGRDNVHIAVRVSVVSPQKQQHQLLATIRSPVPLKAEALNETKRETDPKPASESSTLELSRTIRYDVRVICSFEGARGRTGRARQMLREHWADIRSTKWGTYYLQIVAAARKSQILSQEAACSIRFVICAYARKESATRAHKKLQDVKKLQRKLTDFKVAMQCITGTSVLKYGRKGKPHQAQLSIENGEVFRWTSKLVSQKKKAIPLASILEVRSGPTTEVLARAMEKGLLPLQEGKCTLSLITKSRTFDMKAKNASEREWLHRSFELLISLAREQEKEAAKRAEVAIIKRMEQLNVLKHGRKGKPHRTRLCISRYGDVSWLGRSGDSIRLSSVRSVEAGHHTSVFKRAKKVCEAQRCFSLVTGDRTLDIETESEQVRDWCVVAFQYLLEKVEEKENEMKREKAERNLQMLTKLCRGGF